MKNKIILFASLIACLKTQGVELGPPFIPITPEVPEPSTASLALIGCGVLGFVLYKRKGKKSPQPSPETLAAEAGIEASQPTRKKTLTGS